MNNLLGQNNEVIKYTLKRSARVKHVRLQIDYNKGVVVIAPFHIKQHIIEQFILVKKKWIAKKLKFLAGKTFIKSNKNDYHKFKYQALKLAQLKIKEWNKFYNFTFNSINIKNQKTRWGSCSKKKNLNFNYKIIYLNEKRLNYLIVHELCHLAEFNHSTKFWQLISQTIPDYAKIKKELKQIVV